jgi:hypothetical protein
LAHRVAGAALLVALSVSMLAAPATQAQDDEQGWAEVPDVDGLARLDGGASLAADEGGSTVLVGFEGGDSQSALAWFSPDGTAWEQAEMPGAKRSGALATAAGPGGFVAVGGGKDGGRIWHSPDGRTWSDVGGGLVPSGVVYDVTATPDGYVAVGFVNEGKGKKARSVPTAWTSADGVTWGASQIADVPGASYDVTAGADGALVATLYQPERRGPKTGRTFDIMPPSLEFVTSTDGTAWRSSGDLFVENFSDLRSWDLADTGGRFYFWADAAPGALSTTPDGFHVSEDGATWEPVSGLQGIDGVLGPLAGGAVAIGNGPVLVADDGTAWRSSYVEALAGARPSSVTSLPDGRVLAVGAAGKPGEGSSLYLGTPSLDGPLPSTECLDPAVHSRLLGDGMGLFDLPAPEREQVAATIAAVELTDESTRLTRDRLVAGLRSGGAGDSSSFMRIQSGEVTFPICE